MEKVNSYVLQAIITLMVGASCLPYPKLMWCCSQVGIQYLQLKPLQGLFSYNDWMAIEMRRQKTNGHNYFRQEYMFTSEYTRCFENPTTSNLWGIPLPWPIPHMLKHILEV
jgi:hypothetical protein